MVTSLPISILLPWSFLRSPCQKRDQWIMRDFKSPLPRYPVLLSRISHGPSQTKGTGSIGRASDRGQLDTVDVKFMNACHDPDFRVLFLQHRPSFHKIPVIKSVYSKQNALFLPREGLIHFPASNLNEQILPGRHKEFCKRIWRKYRIGEGMKLACQARADTHPSSSERKQ